MQQSNEWLFPVGTLGRAGWETVVDSSLPGWQHTGLRVGHLKPGEQFELPAGKVERLVVPLSGSFQIVLSQPGDADPTADEAGGPDGSGVIRLDGRRSVFDGPSDSFYLGAGRAASITGDGRVAVAEAPTEVHKPNRYISREEVPVELRGAGRSSRQVHNFGTPQILDADKLIVCEVITPAENWSSYPAHKHDEHIPGEESRLEEIYYFEAEATRGAEAPVSADPFGMFSSYSSPAGQIDTNAFVRTGDVALVPYGYHGPAAAAPGYDLYYLNVMAGPDPERIWNISDDPAHSWIRQTWEGQDFDNRLPYTAAAEEGDRR